MVDADLEKYDIDQIAILLAQLNDKWNKLESIDKIIIENLQNDAECPQEDFDVEFESIEVYSNRYISLKTKTERLINRIELNQESVTDVKLPKRKFKLPRIEFKKYNGELKEYLTFWAQFKKIHDDPETVNEDKFQYLIQATLEGSRARELVESFPPTAENYPQAIECLQNRFGKEENLVEIYVRELLSLVLNNAMGQGQKISLVRLYDKIETHLRSLKILGVTSDKYASMLYPLVESSLPLDILRLWERSFNSNSDDKNCNKLDLLMNFLRNEIQGEEKVKIARSGFGVDNTVKKQNHARQVQTYTKTVPSAAELFATSHVKEDVPFRNSCIFCGKQHNSNDCKYAHKLSIEEKKQILSRKGACFQCLKSSHISRNCKTKINCSRCGQQHLSIMCSRKDIFVPDKNNQIKKTDSAVNTECSLTNRSCSQQVILQTLVVRIRERNCEKLVRVLIDSGSQKSYISKYAVETLGCTSLGEETVHHCLFAGLETTERHKRYLIHLSSMNRDYHCNFEVMDQQNICAGIPTVQNGPWLSELQEHGIIMNDQPEINRNCLYEENTNEIHVLIGADVAGKLLTANIKKLACGLVGVKTLLGWTVMGKIPKEIDTPDSSLLVLSMHVNEAKLIDLWSLDSLGIMDAEERRNKNEMQELALIHFRETVTREIDGRYQVCLPWITDHPPLPNNKIVAEKRLKNTVKSLQTCGILEEYEAVFDDWEKEKIIEKTDLSSDPKDDSNYYLPHRAVIREQSTTKIRPVFDGSARMKDAPSLNDCVEKGPNLIELIPAILNRFRLGKIGVVADIKKAFLQIGLNEQDRKYLQFLWWKNGNAENLITYCHRRVVFGISCSPFLLAATLSLHLEKAPNHLKATADKLKDSLYVDNCIASINSEEELTKFRSESQTLLSAAKFDLRGWQNNKYSSLSKEETIDQLNLENSKTKADDEKNIPVLGLSWNLEEDTLCCDIRNSDVQEKPITKRKILSSAHQIFDPIGFSCPVTLVPKLLLQECWKLKLSWDAELPDEIVRRFEKWKQQLATLKEVKIPRQFSYIPMNANNATLHVFCDASKMAYATCIFLRIEMESEVTCQLVQARSKVAPIKKVSIPRLELLACNIGARLAKSVKAYLRMDEVITYYWSDSMDALYWIKRDAPWATFVSNRVSEIRLLINRQNWNYVKGSLNPADFPSRGCSAQTLAKLRWWEGPIWLRQPKEEWPNFEVVPNLETVNAEKKKTISSVLNTEEDDRYYLRFSSYVKTIRVTGWIYRFLNNTKKTKDSRLSGELTSDEMTKAELKLLKQVQQESFKKNDKRLQSLQTVIDENDLIRIKTRILMREDEKGFRYPIILPSEHHIVKCLIMNKHENSGHVGVQALMTTLREHFWILKSRKTIKNVIRFCVRCRRYSMKPLEVLTPPLPEDRVREANVFSIIGIDVAGPLILKNGHKAWIIIFTCAVFRAVHLELLTAVSTENFLQALRRFIARRGRPSIIYTDNGTNFVGASNLLKNLNWKIVLSYAAVNRIEWKFIPPSAPWWGGWWERLIRILKGILKKTLGTTSLNFEEMITILCDCESLINSRPLTYVSDDPEDLLPITPSMFLQEIQEVGVPDLDQIDTKELNKRFIYRQKIRKDLRNRFRSEYLGQIHQRSKCIKNPQTLKVGDVVIVSNDSCKRLEWPLGKVVELFPGKDGYERVAKVKMRTGTFIRPVQKLYQLESHIPNTNFNANILQKVAAKPLTIDKTSDIRVTTLPKQIDEEKHMAIPVTIPVTTTKSGREIKRPKRYIQ